MGEACAIKAHIKDANGNIVESNLYKSLSQYLDTKREANKYYKLSMSEEFRSTFQDQLDFDKNGEPTFQSFIKAAKIELNDANTRKRIASEIQTGIFDYDIAVQKMWNFNKSHELRDKYLIGLELQNNGKYKTVVLENNTENRQKLAKTLEDYQLVNRINSLLRDKLGVGVLFNQDGNFNGRYTTENATKAANGLYYLVQISRNLGVIFDTLGEEAGHVIVGSLDNSPLIQRLESLLKDTNVQKEILGDEYGKKDLGNNPARELAGDLVGKALINKLTTEQKKHESYSLLKRIVDYAKKIFSKISPDLVYTQIEQSKLAADLIVEGFLAPTYKGNVENNLQQKETLYDRSSIDHIEKATDQYIKAVSYLRKMYNELSAYRLSQFANENLNRNTLLVALDQRTPDLLALTDLNEQKKFAFQYLKYVSELALALANQMQEEDKLQSEILKSYDDNTSVLTDEAERNVFQLLNRYLVIERAVSGVASTLAEFTNAREGSIQLYDEDGNLVEYTFDKPYNELLDACTAMRMKLNDWTRMWFLKFLEKTYGSNYIRSSAKVVLSRSHGLDLTQSGVFDNYGHNVDINKTNKYSQSLLYRTRQTDIPLDEVLAGKNFKDITVYGAWLSVMSDCGDPVQSILKIAIDKANRQKLRETEKDRHELDALYKKLVDTTHNGDTSRFFKRVANKINGYLLAPFDYGKWESAKQEREKELTEMFYKDLLDQFGGDESLVRAYRLSDPLGFASLQGAYLKEAMKEWHKQNSYLEIIDKANHISRYIPNVKNEAGKVSYVDSEYYNLSREEQQWLQDYFKWKREKEKILEGGGVEWRAPQNKGTLANMARNKTGNAAQRWGKAFWDNLIYTFGKINEEDKWSWGADNQSDELESKLYNENENFVEDINRLPMLGVRLRKNLDELNTDLITSSYQYSFMINNVGALKNIVNVAEVGADVLKKQRAVGGQVGVDSHALSAYYRNINRALYNKIPSTFYKLDISYKKVVVIGKALGLIKILGTQLALAWNPNPAMVNVGTGFIELEKEAYAGEFYDYSDLLQAHKLYIASRLSNLKSTVTGDVFLQNDGDIAKFLMYFDCQNNYSERIAKTRKNKFMRVVSDLPFAMYSLGDNYMQGVPFLSMAIHQKLYDTKEHKWVNLTDIYKTTYKPDRSGNPKIEDYGFEEGRYSFFENASEIHNNILHLNNELDAILENEDLAAAWKDFLQNNESTLRPILEEVGAIKKGHNIIEVKKSEKYIKEILKRAEDKLFWNTEHEDKFVSRARNVCNRLHGVYSNIDKVNAAGHPYGAAVLSMRGYALGMIERRFSTNYFNAVLGQDVEGSYVSMLKMILDPQVGTLCKLVEVMSPIGIKNFKRQLKDANYDDNQIANIARTRADIFRAITLYALSHILLGMLENSIASGDDNDDESFLWDETKYSRWLGFLYFMSYKLTREQGAFLFPGYMLSEAGSLGDFLPMGVGALWNFGEATVELLKYAYRYYYDPEWFKYPDREFYADTDEGERQYQEDLKKARSRNRKMWGTTTDLITATREGQELKNGKIANANFWDSKVRKKWSSRGPFPDKFWRKLQDYKKQAEAADYQKQTEQH